MLETYFNDLKRWALHPYREDADAVSWFFFIGLLVCASIFWTRVIKQLVD